MKGDLDMDSSDIPQKRCCTCRGLFPATTDFFGRSKDTKDGFHPICKACRKAYYAAHVDEQSLEYHRQYYQDHKEELAQKSKARNAANKEQRRQYNIAHRAQNAERMRQYRQTEKNKAYRKEYGARRFQEHHAELCQRQHQYYQDNHAEIRQRANARGRTEQGRIEYRAHKHKRKAQKKAVGGTYTAQQIQEQLKRQKGKCYYCKVKFGTIYHIDHVIPLSRGGSNDISNIVLACPLCNMHKHDKLPHEWPEGGRLL